ncbi:MAG TPA: nuclear transport factor 2 family protein [Candidatus Acidoferrum sp.]|nr:nuclear transport factor 2 family protein [Candidatus Acidoferrum sp.]
MGKALEVVNQYYDLLNNKNFSGLKDLLSENMSFTGPVVQRSGANGYIDALKRLFKFHKKSQVLQQFENGNDVCSIYGLIMDKPAGGSLSVVIADWIRVVDGRIAEQKIYYDPREFVKAFPP